MRSLIRSSSLVLAVSSSALISAACSGETGAGGSGGNVDTLPGGIISVNASAPGAWSDTAGWQLVADGALEGDIGTPGEFVDPRDVAVDERGWVYVSDSKPSAVKVFDDKGKYVRSIGREGEGPGEFRVAFLAVRNGLLAVHDPQVSRVTLFDTSGTLRRSWTATCCYWMRPTLDRRGRIAVPMMTPKGSSRAYLRFDTLGTLLDTLLVPEVQSSPEWTFRRGSSMMMSTSVPFAPRREIAFTPEGDVVHGWSGDYRFAVSARGRDTLRIFRREWTAEPISASRRDEVYEQRTAEIARSMEIDAATVRAQFERDKIPSSLPAFAGLSIDPAGNAWVHLEEDSMRTRFDVFDPTGRYLGRVHVPVQVRSFTGAWGSDVMYVRHDTEEGLPRIVRYRIRRTPWGGVTKGRMS